MIVDGNNFISHYLKIGNPLLAGKVGVTELNILRFGEWHKLTRPNIESIRHEVEDIAGMYPWTHANMEKFINRMHNVLGHVDLIPRWNKVDPAFEAKLFEEHCKSAKFTNLQHLEPYFFDKPWTNQLTGKKVLVISPFADSIDINFKKLDKIWNNKIQPNFKLMTLKYPFALKIAPHVDFKTSEDVYRHFIEEIHMTDFDVCITGTGYTSLLLAAEAKKMGKVGIHLGGATQILFGIKGQRWREIKEFQPFFNEHWTDPLPSELPEKRELCEGGCYW